jgi:hypothetical protein
MMNQPIKRREEMLEKVMAAERFVFTLLSPRSGTWKTFQVARIKDKGDAPRPLAWFVGQLTGPDNNQEYSYLGMLAPEGDENLLTFKRTKASPASEGHAGFKAFLWWWRQVTEFGDKLDQVEVWEACPCMRCRKRLTVPKSIERGLGPFCATVWKG